MDVDVIRGPPNTVAVDRWRHLRVEEQRRIPLAVLNYACVADARGGFLGAEDERREMRLVAVAAGEDRPRLDGGLIWLDHAPVELQALDVAHAAPRPSTDVISRSTALTIASTASAVSSPA